MNRRISAAIGIAAISALLLTGCANEEHGAENGGDHTPQYHYTFYQTLPDGGKVLCVWAKSGYGGGPSCDWDNATHGDK